MLVNSKVTFVGTAYADMVEIEVETDVNVENCVVLETTVDVIVFPLVIC
jgi:hypothetical protein